MTALKADRGISQLFALSVVSMGDLGDTGEDGKIKAPTVVWRILVGGIGIYRVPQTQHAGASTAKLNTFNVRGAVAARDDKLHCP